MWRTNTKKLQTFDSNYFQGKIHFEDDEINNYLVYQPVHKYFKKLAKSNKIKPWISTRLSDESIKTPATYDSSLSPGIVVPNYEWNLMEAA